jgi:hypothetical protein
VELTNNQYGLFDADAKTAVRNGFIAGNTVDGILSEFGDVDVENSTISGNNLGIAVSSLQGGNSIARVANCTITDNGTGLEYLGPVMFLSRGDNTVEGNGTNGTFTGSYSAK